MAGHTVLILLSGLVWLTVSIAVAFDAIRRGRSGGVWGITVFLLGPIGLLLYVLVILTAMASVDEEAADQPVRVCPNCGDRNEGEMDRCESCGEPLGPGDEPPSARVIQSGGRSYCSNCHTRVEPETTMCPGCRSAL